MMKTAHHTASLLFSLLLCLAGQDARAGTRVISADSAVILSPAYRTALDRDSVAYLLEPRCETKLVVLFVRYFPSITDTLARLTAPPFSAWWRHGGLPDQDQLHLQFGYVLYHKNGDTIVSPPLPHRCVIDRQAHRSKKRVVVKQARPEETFLIDGRLDEWNRFPPTWISPQARFRCAWTGADFFIAVEVTDTQVTAGDRVELFFDIPRSRGRFLDINHRVISFGPKSRSFSLAVDLRDTGAVYVDSIVIRIAEEMTWRGARTATGYAIEARIPFCVLSALPFPPRVVGFDIGVVDAADPRPGRPHVSTWSGAPPSARHTPGGWGTIVFRQLFLPLKIVLGSALLVVFLLVAAMLALMIYRKQSDRRFEKREKTEPSPAVKKVLAAIDENIRSETLHAAALARLCGISAEELEKCIRRELNTSCRSLILVTRIKKARALLADPQIDIAEVARAVGFTDPAAFEENFRRIAGLSPARFRRNRLEDARDEEEESPSGNDG